MILILLSLAEPGFGSATDSKEASKVTQIPLAKSDWLTLAFNKIKPNQVVHASQSLEIQVNSSAGPIIYKLAETRLVIGFRVQGLWSGEKAIEKTNFDEDSILRVGLVIEGKKTLTGPQRWFAAKWVKTLFELAPKGTGIDRIHFYNITNRPQLLNLKREHPKSALMTETIVAVVEKPQGFAFEYKFSNAARVVAIWLSADGDQSHSRFSTTLEKLELQHP